MVGGGRRRLRRCGEEVEAVHGDPVRDEGLPRSEPATAMR